MKPNPDKTILQLYRSLIFLLSLFVILAILALGYLTGGSVIGQWFQKSSPVAATSTAKSVPAVKDDDWDKVENGIHLRTGLIVAEGFETVKAVCTACHSGKLIAQNRATREGWEDMIRWMQKTQGLWDLGDKEGIILEYLAANYAPEEVGRRANLNVEEIEWYILEEVE